MLHRLCQPRVRPSDLEVLDGEAAASAFANDILDSLFRVLKESSVAFVPPSDPVAGALFAPGTFPRALTPLACCLPLSTLAKTLQASRKSEPMAAGDEGRGRVRYCGSSTPSTSGIDQHHIHHYAATDCSQPFA